MAFIRKNTDLIQKTNGITLRTQLNKELMSITPFNGNLNDYREIKIGQLNNVLSVVPNVLASQTLSQAYRVVMPNGAIGNLMQYKNGLLGTPIVDPITHKITAHAGLASLNPSAIALGAFTAASFVTGQYFMAEIHKELKGVKNGLKRIEGMLEDTKISEIQAAINFIEYAETNLNEIVLINEHKIATLTNIQNNTNLLLQNSIYYERQIQRTVDAIGDTRKTNEVDYNYKKLQELIGLWCICSYGYYYGKTIEIKLSENFDSEYLKRTENELMEKAEFFNVTIKNFYENLCNSLDNSSFIQRDFLENTLGFFDDTYETKNEIKAENVKLQFNESRNDLNKKYQELCEIPRGIKKLRNLNEGFEYVVKDNNIYIFS